MEITVMDMPTYQPGASELAMARSRVYLLVATGFSYPTHETHASLADGSYAESLAAMLAASMLQASNAGVDAILASLRTPASLEDFQASYLNAFETDMPAPSVSLYEGSYVSKNNRSQLLLELKAFYRNFGLEMAGQANDLEDTLTAELEFMQFLAAKQAQAEEGGSSSDAYVLAQRDFLQRHLAQWLPAFAEAVKAKVADPFFASLAELASSFVAEDFLALQRRVVDA